MLNMQFHGQKPWATYRGTRQRDIALSPYTFTCKKYQNMRFFTFGHLKSPKTTLKHY